MLCQSVACFWFEERRWGWNRTSINLVWDPAAAPLHEDLNNFNSWSTNSGTSSLTSHTGAAELWIAAMKCNYQTLWIGWSQRQAALCAGRTAATAAAAAAFELALYLSFINYLQCHFQGCGSKPNHVEWHESSTSTLSPFSRSPGTGGSNSWAELICMLVTLTVPVCHYLNSSWEMKTSCSCVDAALTSRGAAQACLGCSGWQRVPLSLPNIKQQHPVDKLSSSTFSPICSHKHFSSVHNQSFLSSFRLQAAWIC